MKEIDLPRNELAALRLFRLCCLPGNNFYIGPKNRHPNNKGKYGFSMGEDKDGVKYAEHAESLQKKGFLRYEKCEVILEKAKKGLKQ